MRRACRSLRSALTSWPWLLLVPAAARWGSRGVSPPRISAWGCRRAKIPRDSTVVLQIFLLMTVLSLAPAILIMVTSFTRIVIVLSLLRRALGTMQLPSNQIVIGLALFLTVFIMAPVWQKINQAALQPYLDKTISGEQALENGRGAAARFHVPARPAKRTWPSSWTSPN